LKELLIVRFASSHTESELSEKREKNKSSLASELNENQFKVHFVSKYFFSGQHKYTIDLQQLH